MGYVIVLDPGHGGSADGGNYGSLFEKNLSLELAKAMKTYLDNFDDVTVYLTRNDDTELSIAQRLDFAKACNADYFISLHFNMSTLHNLYGNEIWLPMEKNYYNKLYGFADQIVSSYEAMGLHNRGIKTREGKSGNYYGVIRIGTEYGIPSCIVEHCYLDNYHDASMVPTQKEALMASLRTMGVNDGDCLAKALHLKSTALNIDYSGYAVSNYKTKNSMVKPDETEPETNEISLLSTDITNATVTINMHATDSNGFIQYYMVSYDGGLTYAELKDYPRSSWNKSLSDAQIVLNVPKNKDLDIVTCAINGYDLMTVSNHLNISALSYSETMDAKDNQNEEINIKKINVDKIDAADKYNNYETISYDITQQGPNFLSGKNVFSIAIFVSSAILILIVLIVTYKSLFRKKRK